MKKLICLGLLTLVIALLFNCAGMPEESSSPDITYSFILNHNFQEAEYQKLNNQTQGLVGSWQAENNSRNLYSIIQFDDNNNFLEQVHNKLTHEIMGSYEGNYNINIDLLEIMANKGDVYQFSFNLNADKLQLSAK